MLYQVKLLIFHFYQLNLNKELYRGTKVPDPEIPQSKNTWLLTKELPQKLKGTKMIAREALSEVFKMWEPWKELYVVLDFSCFLSRFKIKEVLNFITGLKDYYQRQSVYKIKSVIPIIPCDWYQGFGKDENSIIELFKLYFDDFNEERIICIINSLQTNDEYRDCWKQIKEFTNENDKKIKIIPKTKNQIIEELTSYFYHWMRLKPTILLSCNPFFTKCLEDNKKKIRYAQSESIKKIIENSNIKLEFKIIVTPKCRYLMENLLDDKLNEKVKQGLVNDIDYFIINC